MSLPSRWIVRFCPALRKAAEEAYPEDGAGQRWLGCELLRLVEDPTLTDPTRWFIELDG